MSRLIINSIIAVAIAGRIMLSEQDFVKNIQEMERLTTKHCSPEDCWSVKKASGLRAYAKCSDKFIEMIGGKFLKRSATICYNDVYNVPVLWFNVYNLDGSLVDIDELGQLIANENGYDSAEISQNEHPVYGIAYYNFHPCRTAAFMKELRTNNRVLSFLLTLGKFLDFNFPLELLMEISKD